MKFSIIITAVLSFLQIANAQESSIDSIKHNIKSAIAYSLTALTKTNPNYLGLTDAQVSLVNENKKRVISEFKKINDDLGANKIFTQQSNVFVHFNQPTWIETEIKPFGLIRLGSADIIKNKKQFGPKMFMHYFLHEIAHHLLASKGEVTQLIEAEAWRIASAFENFKTDFNSRIVSISTW